MTTLFKTIVLTTSMLLCSASFAQATATTAKVAQAMPAAAVPAPATVTAPATSLKDKTAKMAKTAAVGGGADKVWVNSKSNTYHCFGTKYYGKTTAGSYMSESDAKSKGAHADHGKACKAA